MVNDFHIAEYYDLIFKEKDYQGDIDRCFSTCETKGLNLDKVLDIGAGTANHSIILSKHVNSVLAVEIDPRMAAIGQKKTEHIKQIKWLISDVVNLNLPQNYSYAFAMFNVLNYVLKLDEFFESVYKGLKPGGKFFFDVWDNMNLTSGTQQVQKQIIHKHTPINLFITTEVGVNLDIATLSYRFLEENQTAINAKEFNFKIYLWTKNEIESSAKKAGFRSIERIRINPSCVNFKDDVRPLYFVTK